MYDLKGSKKLQSSTESSPNFEELEGSRPRPRTWPFEAKDFKNCLWGRPRGQGRLRGRHSDRSNYLRFKCQGGSDGPTEVLKNSNGCTSSFNSLAYMGLIRQRDKEAGGGYFSTGRFLQFFSMKITQF